MNFSLPIVSNHDLESKEIKLKTLIGRL